MPSLPQVVPAPRMRFFLLEEVGAAFGYERFRPCNIRAIVLFTLIPTTAMLYYKTTTANLNIGASCSMATRTRPTLTVRPYAPTLFSSRGVNANDLISIQREWSNHRIVTASTCSMKHLLLSKFLVQAETTRQSCQGKMSSTTVSIYHDRRTVPELCHLVVRQNRVAAPQL
jgi:hypothetical protein